MWVEGSRRKTGHARVRKMTPVPSPEYNNGVDEFKAFVTSSPLRLSSPTTNNEVSSTTSDLSEASTKSSSSFHTCVEDFDPDAVDFEPLLVSGTGKVLTYHSSFDTDDIISIDSSVATPITRNGNRYRRASCSSSRLKQLVLIAILAAIIVERLSSLSIYTLNSTESMEIAMNRIPGRQNMQDVVMAAYKASTSRIAVWDPFLEDTVSASNQNLMIIVSQCFARPTFYFRKENAGSYTLQETSTTVKESTQQQLPYNNNVNHLMAIFTQNFNQVALDLFDNTNLGAFVVILHDPVAIYFERYSKGILQRQNTKYLGQYAKEYLPESTINDNLLVRYLSGINDINRTVNSDDYDIARHVLMTKFVIAGCNYPVNTIRRLERMFGPSHDSFGVEECYAAKQRWNEECKNTNEVTKQRRSNDSNQVILRNLESDNHFDFKLYEESKSIMNEQNKLFGLE
jgi:hypothetical protein